MELPFHLKTIEPLKGALDIIRYLGQTDAHTVNSDEFCTELDLSERTFSKAIRRLVTKGYVVMDGDMEYRLTEQGQDAVEELLEYDMAAGAGPTFIGDSAKPDADAAVSAYAASPQVVRRRLVMAVPAQAVVGQNHRVLVGFHDAAPDAQADDVAQVVARVSVLNGDPQRPEDLIYVLGNEHAHEEVQVKPHPFTEFRIKVEVFQLGDDPGDISQVGGMYVDVPVVSGGGNSDLIAYGTDIELTL